MKRWLGVALGLLALLRLGYWLGAFPNPDEAYYWLWGQRLGLSYYDHPPFHAWVQGLFSRLGHSYFVLRLPNLVSNLLLVYTFSHIHRYLFPTDSSLGALGWPHSALGRTVALLASSPLYFLFLAMAWHDHWLVTFGLMAGYCYVRFIDSYLADGRGRGRWLVAAAVLLGLGVLCKYTAVLVGLAMVGLAMWDRRLWRLWADWRVYGAIALTSLALVPIGLWNWANDFQSFRFYADRTVADSGFTLHWGSALFFVLLTLLIWSPVQTWLLVQLGRKPVALERPTVYPTFAWMVFGVSTGTITLVALTSGVALYYWNILAYGMLLPLLAQRLHRTGETAPLRLSLGLGAGVALILVIHFTLLPLSALIDPDIDPDSRMVYGWDQVGAVVQQRLATFEDPLVLTTDYRSASALAYQLNRRDVLALSGRIDQFDFWYDAPALQGRDGVLLGDDWHPICPALLDQFADHSPLEPISVYRWGVFIKTYYLTRVFGFEAGPPGYPLSPDYPLSYTRDGETCE